MLDKNEGTYNHCSICKIKKNCCCDFDDSIDNIVTTIYEKEQIIQRLGNSAEVWFSQINEEAFNILSNKGICPFYKNGCTIYDIRPSDCRLFPYDLKEINNQYYLIKYNLPCGSNKVNENVDNVVEVLKTIIKTYTNKKIEEKVNKLNYTIIKKI